MAQLAYSIAAASESRPWYAVHTKSRHEKVLHKELLEKGIESFLPLRLTRRRWSDRTKLIEEPLFKGYLFTRVPFDDRFRVLQSAGAMRFVGALPTVPWEIAEKEICSIKRFITEKIQIDPYPYLKEGHRVYVRNGPLRGVEGIIVQKKRHFRLVVSVEMMMQSVAVDIDEADVEPLGG